MLADSKRVGRAMKHAQQSQFSQVTRVTEFNGYNGSLGVITLIRDFRERIIISVLYQFK